MLIIDRFEQSLVSKPTAVTEQDWYGMHDVYSYLSDPLSSRVPLYISQSSSHASAVVYSALVPKTILHEKWQEELKDWQFDPYHTWSRGWTNEDGVVKASLFPPYSETSEKILESAHPIVIPRYNPPLPEGDACIDISQEITHAHSLHWSKAHSAYIRLDELGDPEKCIRVRSSTNNRAVDILSDLLKLHLFIGHYVLIRLFDFRRWNMDSLLTLEISRDKKVVAVEQQNIYGSLLETQYKDGARFYQLRGFQCVSIQEGEEQVLWQELKGEKSKEYCEFIILDWKNERVVRCSSDPKATANYFTKSDLPYGTSAAFFRREVLGKYKNNPEKYTIGGTIDCRGAWSLRYGINDVGQIHIYICDLALLPYKEQLYWQIYNEEPKAGLSASTVRRDFYAECVFDPPDPLSGLKSLLVSFPSVEGKSKSSSLWTSPDGDTIKQLIYMTGESQKEWEEDIHLLDKAVVEGFEPKFLRKLVQSLDPSLHEIETLGSIKLLDHILHLKGIAEDIRDDIIRPLMELREIRSKICGHRKGDDAAKIITSIRVKHKTFSKHQKYLIEKLYTAMWTLAQLVKKGVFATDS